DRIVALDMALAERDARLSAERAESDSKLAAMQQQVVRTREQAARDIWAEREHWTSLLAYRAGDVLVNSLARPWTLPLLPFRLFSAWRGYRADRQARQSAGQGKAAA